MTLCFDQLKQEKPCSVELLFLISTLDPQGIPETLLFREADQIRPFNAAKRLLKALALVTYDTTGENIWVDRLVQSWTRNNLEREQMVTFWDAEATRLLSNRFPHGEFFYWRIYNFLLPHAEAVITRDLAKDLCLHCGNTYLLHRATLVQSMASYDEHRGFYSAAHAKYGQALSIYHGHEWIGERIKLH
jgi:hypothetical protein